MPAHSQITSNRQKGCCLLHTDFLIIQYLSSRLWGFLRRFIHFENWPENVGFIRLHNMPIHDHFVENKVRLFDVEHNIEFAHVFEILIHSLDERVDEL